MHRRFLQRPSGIQHDRFTAYTMGFVSSPLTPVQLYFELQSKEVQALPRALNSPILMRFQRHHFFIDLFMAIALHTGGVGCLFSAITRVSCTDTSFWYRVASSPSGCLRETPRRFAIYSMDDHDRIGPLHKDIPRFLVGTTIPIPGPDNLE